MRATEDAAFLDRMVAEARLPADARPLAAALLARADAIEVASFADVAETERGALRQLIERLPPAVAFGETAPATAITVADPRNPASIEAAADALIKARADAGQTLTFREAVRLVVNEETSA